jgi:peptidoglycan hydrolase-like protein with peptidoglycan-binding domain
MKRTAIIICLSTVALFGGLSASYAMSKCQGSPAFGIEKQYQNTIYRFNNGLMQKFIWNKCIGIVNYVNSNGAIVSTYKGEFRHNQKSGDGIYKFETGKVREGVWHRDNFKIAKKTRFSISVEPSVLQSTFSQLPKKARLQIQRSLANLNYYNAEIDGIFGKTTASALKIYNKKIFEDVDLTKVTNVEKLLNAILSIGSVKPIEPKTVKDPAVKTKPKITEAPKPVTNKEAELFGKIQKDFGLNYYGGFLHTDRLPKTLFFFSEIRKNDSFEFRKALRVHDIELVVLSSPGGSVYEGLQTAGIIHDKKLKTYIPNKSLDTSGICASACSFMFFAGANRSAEGGLGVHQFYSGRASDKAEIGVTQKTAQFTVSEIIGFLNEFETPAWVYERMFQQSEMYYFTESELLQLETEVSEETKAQHDRVESFISDFRAALKTIGD